MAPWTLRDRGRVLAVRTEDNRVFLTIDDTEIESSLVGKLGSAEFSLTEPEQTVRVEMNLRGDRIRSARLVEGESLDQHAVSFIPPAQTLARRSYDLRESHPHLFAARHILFTVVGFLGIGALISAFLAQFLPAIDWSWLPEIRWPQINLNLPEWLKYLSPIYWLKQVPWPAINLPDWLANIPWRYVIALAVACFIALAEIDRREKRAQREQDHDEDS